MCIGSAKKLKRKSLNEQRNLNIKTAIESQLLKHITKVILVTKPNLDDERITDCNGSPLLDLTTKMKLLGLGQSLDSKQVSDALGFIDIRMLLKCFAKAVSRHIDFSKGYLIFEDMKKYSSMKDKMKFTYNQNKNMKIDMERLKKKANQNKLDKEKEVKSKEHSDEPHQSNRTECAGEQATATEIVGLNSKSDKSKMNLEDLAKHRITINDSEILEGTINGNTLLTQTNVFEVENKLKTSICQSSLNKFGKDETYDLSNSVISSKMFNLSNDSTVRLSESQISSFVTTLDNKGVSTLKSSTSGFGDSLAYSNTALSMLKETSKCIPLEVIKSEDGESSSKGNIEENHQESKSFEYQHHKNFF